MKMGAAVFLLGEVKCMFRSNKKNCLPLQETVFLVTCISACFTERDMIMYLWYFLVTIGQT